MRKPKRIKSEVVMSALDLKDYRNFDGINDARHFVGRTSRSASEAFKDASYAQAMWKCESDFMQGLRFLRGMLEGMGIVLFALAVPVLVLLWLTK